MELILWLKQCFWHGLCPLQGLVCSTEDQREGPLGIKWIETYDEPTPRSKETALNVLVNSIILGLLRASTLDNACIYFKDMSIFRFRTKWTVQFFYMPWNFSMCILGFKTTLLIQLQLDFSQFLVKELRHKDCD